MIDLPHPEESEPSFSAPVAVPDQAGQLFALQPDPRHFFPVKGHAPLWRMVIEATAQEEGVILLTGEPGVGKTLFLLRLQEILPEERQMVILTYLPRQPERFPALLLTAIDPEASPSQPGEEESGTNEENFPQALARVLEKRIRSRRRQLLLAIDEAHFLSEENLDYLVAALNYEVKGVRPLQLLLCGRPELNDFMEDPPFRALLPAVIGKGEIPPLTLRETREYVLFLLEKATCPLPACPWTALLELAGYAHGIPRQINRVLRQLLNRLEGEESCTITAKMVRLALAGGLRQGKGTGPWWGPWWGLRRHLLWITPLFFLLPATGFLVGKGFVPENRALITATIPLEEGSPPVKPAEPLPTAAISPREIPAPVEPPPKKGEGNKAPAPAAIAPPVEMPAPVKAPPAPTIPIIPVVPISEEHPPAGKPHGAAEPTDEGKKPTNHGNGSPTPLENPIKPPVSAPPPAAARSALQATAPSANNEAVYVVMAGSYRNRENAERVVQRLSEKGLGPYIHIVRTGDQTFYAVWIDFPDEKSAKQMAQRLHEQDKLATRVIHNSSP